MKIIKLKRWFKKPPKVPHPPRVPSSLLPKIPGAIEFFAQTRNSKTFAKVDFQYVGNGTFRKSSAPHAIRLKIAYGLVSALAILPAYGIYSVASTSLEMWKETNTELVIPNRINKHLPLAFGGEVKGTFLSSEAENTNTGADKQNTNNSEPKHPRGLPVKNLSATVGDLTFKPQNIALQNTSQPQVLGISTFGSSDDIVNLIDQRIDESLKNGKIPVSFTTTPPNGYTSSIGGIPVVGYFGENRQDNYDGGSITSFSYLSSKAFATGKLDVSGSLNLNGGANLIVTGNSTLATTTINGLTVSGLNPGLTAGSVVFQGASGLAQDNSNFYWDDTNNRLGIGTSTPSQKLVLAGGNFFQTSGNPTIVGGVNYSTAFPSGYRTQVVGKYLYVSTYSSSASIYNFMVFDISSPANPVLIGGITDTTNLKVILGFRVVGKYAYFVSHTNGFTVVDVSNPSQMRVVKRITSASKLGLSEDVVVSGNYAYIVNFNTGGSISNLTIIDISNPVNPVIVGSLTDDANLGVAQVIKVVGKYAYIGTGAIAAGKNFAIVDVSDPANPVVVGTIADPTNLSYISELQVIGRYAYALNYGEAAGTSNFAVIDISSSTAPSVVGAIDDDINLSNGIAFSVNGRYAYVASLTNSTSRSGFAVVDILNPTNMSVVAAIAPDAANLISPNGLTMSGKYAYIVSAGSSAGNKVLTAIDVSGIDAPTANIGLLSADSLNVSNYAEVKNNLSVGGGLAVTNGIQSSGAISIQAPGLSTSTAFNIYNASGTPLLNVLANGNIGIGTSAPSSQFTITGGLNSAFGFGTSTLQSGVGIIDANGGSALVGTPIIGAASLVQMTVTTASTTESAGQISQLVNSGSSLGTGYGAYNVFNNSNLASVGIAIGAYNLTANFGSSTVTNQAYGSLNRVLNSSGTIVSAFGVSSLVNNTGASSSITSASAFFAGIRNSSTGSITNAHGIRISSPTNSGTITNNYGLYIADQALTGVNSYNIHSLGANSRNYLQGYLSVGTTSTSTTLTLQGIAGPDVLDVSSSTGVSLFRITKDGNVGIGSSSPTALATIQGTSGSLNDLLNVASSTAESLFIVKSSGNVGIGTSTPGIGPLVMASGAFVTTGGTWTNASDKNLKENFADIDPINVLQKINLINIQQWNYKSESAATTHIGPTAQDFYEQFHLGNSDTSISTIDPAGVALLGIQGLSKFFGLQGGLTNIASSTPITIASQLYLSGDSVGQAKILSGATSVRINFDKPYQYQPIVTITPMNFITGAFKVTEADSVGFTIEIQQSQLEEVTFNWHGFAGAQAKLTVSDGSTQNIVLLLLSSNSQNNNSNQNSNSSGQAAPELSSPSEDPEPEAGQIAGTSTPENISPAPEPEPSPAPEQDPPQIPPPDPSLPPPLPEPAPSPAPDPIPEPPPAP